MFLNYYHTQSVDNKERPEKTSDKQGNYLQEEFRFDQLVLLDAFVNLLGEALDPGRLQSHGTGWTSSATRHRLIFILKSFEMRKIFLTSIQ